MNRNVESRFSTLPRIDVNRSTFDMSHDVKTSFNVGDVIPFDVMDILPADTVSISTSKLLRLQTLLTPVMDNAYLDVYYFFVPNRLVWNHWKNFMGENTESAWTPTTEYEIPQIESPSGGFAVGTIADYMGVPTGVDNLSFSALYGRAYALVCNEFFRDENLTDPLNIPVGDETQTGSNGSSYINDVANMGMPFKAAKYHDYFTSCLPAPQKGPDVPLPVAAGSTTELPVFGTGKNMALSDGSELYGWWNTSSEPLIYKTQFGQDLGSNDAGLTTAPNRKAMGLPTKEQMDTAEKSYDLTGLYADGSAFGINVGTINELRMAFQMQKYYEKLARGGSRYVEFLKQFFSVDAGDYRLQRPEYLGGSRIPLNINQVIQTSATQAQQGLDTTPQGTTTAYSLTADTHHDFTKSFVEHGVLLGLAVVRYDHSYQQGLNRMFTRKTALDFYNPVFANIGEQSVKNIEIYAQGSEVINEDTGKAYDDEVFGYQEAWADYRYRPNMITGEMRSQYATSLDLWHWADDYESLPYLSDDWIREDKTNVDRSLAVTSLVSNQILANFFIKCRATRPMPLYSIPGLIDHH